MNNSEIPQMAAAGGLVLRGGHALLIRKHGLWDIPKGKIKKKEPPQRCARREIAEETGLKRKRLRIREHFCRTSYISYYSGKPFNKTVDWFLLDYGDGSLTDPLEPDPLRKHRPLRLDTHRRPAIHNADRPPHTSAPSEPSLADNIHLLHLAP